MIDELKRRLSGNGTSIGSDDLGESPLLSEWLVVAPILGRFLPVSLEPGQVVARGEKVGVMGEGSTETTVTAHSSGIFIAWMVVDGERVGPGRPLGRFGKSEV